MTDNRKACYQPLIRSGEAIHRIDVTRGGADVWLLTLEEARELLSDLKIAIQQAEKAIGGVVASSDRDKERDAISTAIGAGYFDSTDDLISWIREAIGE